MYRGRAKPNIPNMYNRPWGQGRIQGSGLGGGTTDDGGGGLIGLLTESADGGWGVAVLERERRGVMPTSSPRMMDSTTETRPDRHLSNHILAKSDQNYRMVEK